jgi:hypothetical protein
MKRDNSHLKNFFMQEDWSYDSFKKFLSILNYKEEDILAHYIRELKKIEGEEAMERKEKAGALLKQYYKVRLIYIILKNILYTHLMMNWAR